MLTGVLFGLMPALRAFALRDALVVAQVALSLVLLVGAGILLRSFLYCLNLDLGFARKSALIVRLDPGLPAAIINETMARRFWPGEDPIGRTIEMRRQPLQIVGVVKDVKVNWVLGDARTLHLPALRPGLL